MIAKGNEKETPLHTRVIINTLWFAIAMLVCLSVVLLNRTPLTYHDTFAYLNRGFFLIDMMKDILGLDSSPILEDINPAPQGQQLADPNVAGQRILDGKPANEGRTISASRSRAYSFFLGFFASVRLIGLAPVFNAAFVMVAVWLPIRVAARQFPSILSPFATVAITLSVSALGSLPFFVAYLMPDIFAAVLILTIGSLAVFARNMNRWEILASVLIGSFAVTTHITHLAIAASLVPVVAVISAIFSKNRWWFATILVGFMSVFGLAEQTTYKVAVEAQTDLEAVFQPFLTARLIQDKIGYEYLQRHCPDETIATCALYEALSYSDNPRRLTASHILFRKSEELGSFLLMSENDRRAVAQAQFTFYRDVFFDVPGKFVLAMLRNTIVQVRLNRIDQTVKNSGSKTIVSGKGSLGLSGLGKGRLTRDLFWLGPVLSLHNAVYVLSLIVIVPLLLWPGVLPPKIKAFVLVIMLGILANAFICGALSQPAARYGGRVIWLLPFAATISVLYATFMVRRFPGR